MPLWSAKRKLWMRTSVMLCLGLLITWASAYSQQQLSGRVINRNGSPQAGCLVEFFWNTNQPPTYRVTTNTDGVFYLTNPRWETYTVWVRQGQQRYSTTVRIDRDGLHPPTLVVTW
jgi:hypothetical protein